jgi:polyphosphate kinase
MSSCLALLRQLLPSLLQLLSLLMTNYLFFNRDLSWLTFNERVLDEARSPEVPLLEQIRFLSIFSSNLDEFYRVRMPVLRAIKGLSNPDSGQSYYQEAIAMINQQQQLYGQIVREIILPKLLEQQVDWLYNKAIPEEIIERVNQLFDTEIKDYIKIQPLDLENRSFFAENNKLYQGVYLANAEGEESLAFLCVPVEQASRLLEIEHGQRKYIVFIEDIIRHNLNKLFPLDTVVGAYNIKVTRDAAIVVEDEVDANIISALERELAKRDYGPATRFLCQPDVPLRHLYKMVYALNLTQADIVSGGFYHNLKDLSHFPLKDPSLEYPKWPALKRLSNEGDGIFNQMRKKDIMIHVPYESYDPVLAFFQEAAADPEVTEVYCTLYRVADPSSIVKALVDASGKGKKVVVMLELKARFDEANNIKWANALQAGGVHIIYSSSKLKVHAKVALVKRKQDQQLEYFGLLSTGNLNETTAKFYTDHILLTAYEPMLKELETLFGVLATNKSMKSVPNISFEHLLVAQFNLQSRFLELIDREIANAKKGLAASITIKLNNLEEKVLISKLYEASNAGVTIQLIVRSICCLVPGIPGQSENIQVKRIVDRYLEHGRVFLFHNSGEEEVFMGSADWMNRNVYSRIEVCFPVYDPELKNNLRDILLLQWRDTAKAVSFSSDMKNIALSNDHGFRSQEEIYNLISQQIKIYNYEAH